MAPRERIKKDLIRGLQATFGVIDVLIIAIAVTVSSVDIVYMLNLSEYML